MVVEPLDSDTKLTRDRGVQTVLMTVHEPINGQPDQDLAAVAGHPIRLFDTKDDAWTKTLAIWALPANPSTPSEG
ncbi:hypothetical protein X740_10900 [Mesorhizobium sp. LNHC221B00]|nr:hypothetical protein X740_10900 [Mesorhizobium sp. LNHC221B00]